MSTTENNTTGPTPESTVEASAPIAAPASPAIAADTPAAPPAGSEPAAAADASTGGTPEATADTSTAVAPPAADARPPKGSARGSRREGGGGSGGGGEGRPAPQGEREPIDLAATTALLKQHFPALFTGGAKPVKLRIQQDIQQRAPGVFTRPALSAFLRRYTGSTSYLLALSQATNRFDLDGQPSDELTAEHRQIAVDELARRRALQQERRAATAPGGGQSPQQHQQQPHPPHQPDAGRPPKPPRVQEDPAVRAARAAEDEQRRRRAGLLRDFRATTLTKANFCALKRITPEELDQQLVLAEQEMKAAWEAHPAGPREAHGRDDRRRDGPRDGPPGGPREMHRDGPRDTARPPREPRTDARAEGRTDDRPARPPRPPREPQHTAGGAAPAARPAAPKSNGERPDEVLVSFVFTAPTPRVFAAWTDATHLGAWWPREGWTLSTSLHELRAGGAWRFVLRSPDGSEHPNRIDHVGVFTPERLVYDHGADDDSPRWFRVSLSFKPQGEGTSLKMRLRFASAEERDAAVNQQHLPDGVKLSLQRLEAYLATPAGLAAVPAMPVRAAAAPRAAAPAAAAAAPKPAPGVRVHAEPLRALVRAVVERGGSSTREASLVAQYLVEANLTGHDSHGVGMLPRYVENLLGGGLFANRSLRIVADTGALLTLDGQAGYGQVMGHDAMALGIERAKAHGVAVVGLANSHHIGRIGQWAEQCLAEGLVSVHFVNVISTAIVAPYNGTDGRFVTNPMCVGIPVEGAEPIVLDFATSRIAMGKVRVAYNKGEKLGRGILIDSTGRPTVEPGVMFNEPIGALLPFGEHKGYGLAVVCEILGGALSGGITLHAPANANSIINNMTSFIVDPSRMGTAQRMSDEAKAFAAWVQASPPRAGHEVMLPGDPERRRRVQRGAEGIEIDATTWAQLLDAGRKLGLDDAAMLALAGLPAAEAVAAPAAPAVVEETAPAPAAESAAVPAVEPIAEAPAVAETPASTPDTPATE